MTTPNDELQREIDFICRGAEDIVPMDELRAKLKRSKATGKPLRVKYGIDPTGLHVHLGHTVPLGIFRRFQEAGHTGVIIIGDYTARVGDPSGRNESRPQLTGEKVQEYANRYLEQIARVVHMDKAEVHYNGEWFAKMNFSDILRLTSRMTVAQVLERDDFRTRYNAGTAISLHEFLYPLMQGWDSVEIKADVELGGTEQLFNLNVGRALQKEEGQEPQVCVTVPILVGTDGVRRMGKSLGNYIGIEDAPTDMFGKVMSVPDAAMLDYFRMATELPLDGIAEMHPRDAKVMLGQDIVRRYHGAAAAKEALEHFERVFKNKEIPDDMPELVLGAGDLDADGAIFLPALIVKAGFAKSNGEARRHVEGRAVSINQQKVEDIGNVTLNTGDILQVGKRQFCKIKIEG